MRERIQMASILRIKAWAHWVLMEKEPDEDRLLMANDIKALVEIVEKTKDYLSDYADPNDLQVALLAEIGDLYKIEKDDLVYRKERRYE